MGTANEREFVGTAKERELVGTAKKRELVGTTKEKELVGTEKERELVGTTKERELVSSGGHACSLPVLATSRTENRNNRKGLLSLSNFCRLYSLIKRKGG